MAALLLVLGAVLFVSGFALVHWPLGLIASGFLLLAAGVDLTRPT